MWFRNIQFYRFTEPFTLTGTQLGEALEKKRCRPCGQMEPFCNGWSEPLGQSGHTLVHETDGNLMMCLRREDKVLPASIVREQVAARVFEIEQSGRTAGRKEKGEIRERVLVELLPRALVRSSHTYACILPKEGWLIVDAGSKSKADDLIEALNKTLITLPVVLPETKRSAESAMTEWMMNPESLPDGFAIGEGCDLHDAVSAGVVRCKHFDVLCDKVRAHVTDGMSVSKLALLWRERVSFVLGDDLTLKQLKFDSALVDEAADQGGDDAAARFDADFALMAPELGRLLPELLQAVDGTG